MYKTSTSFREQCRQVLEEGRKRFGLSLCIVSQIDGNDYHVISVQDARNVFAAGDTYDLSNTYCREVVKEQKPLALPHKDVDRDPKSHPLYGNFPLEAYISAPVFDQGKFWGTLNFSDFKPLRVFTDKDVTFIEALAEKLSSAPKSDEDRAFNTGK